jgi:hypothetical protein
VDEDEILTLLDEVKFWRRHREDLGLMKKQMRSEAVQAIYETVKKLTSVFVKQFMEIEKEVDEQLELVTEKKRPLLRLHRFLEQVDTVIEGLDALQGKFKLILHLLYLMYKRTRWYHRPRHICSVVRRVTDFLMSEFITPIDGTSIFGGYPVDLLRRAQESCAAVKSFGNSSWVSRRSC